ncbi:MAG: hypothetical protein K2J29_02035 [Muribaculaceae bacterium]|nr:hypothetical protein [Muribaculaceae bacterium]MDE6842782.1 hypothetical protein [Muribaculaceae bacterium]
MTTNKQEYCSKFASAMLNNVAAVILREIKTRVSVSSSDRDAENIIRFHAHQLATFGTINREDVTSLAQRRVARVLNHIIDTHLNF